MQSIALLVLVAQQLTPSVLGNGPLGITGFGPAWPFDTPTPYYDGPRNSMPYANWTYVQNFTVPGEYNPVNGEHIGGEHTGLEAVSFGSPMVGCAVGQNGLIVTTRDGGLSWSRQYTNATLNTAAFWPAGPGTRHLDLKGVSFPEPMIGFIVGGFGSDDQYSDLLILATTDGGATWVRQSPPQGLSWHTPECMYLHGIVCQLYL